MKYDYSKMSDAEFIAHSMTRLKKFVDLYASCHGDMVEFSCALEVSEDKDKVDVKEMLAINAELLHRVIEMKIQYNPLDVDQTLKHLTWKKVAS